MTITIAITITKQYSNNNNNNNSNNNYANNCTNYYTNNYSDNYTNNNTNISLGGILPFGACFVELFFIMSSIWMDQYYYVFGFLLLVYVILGVTCAEITIVLNYFQLCSEGTYVRARYTYVRTCIHRYVNAYMRMYVRTYVRTYTRIF